MEAFTCRLVAKDELGQRLLKLYHVEAIFDVNSSQYACKLVLKSSFTDLLSTLKSNNVQLELEVRALSASVQQMNAIWLKYLLLGLIAGCDAKWQFGYHVAEIGAGH